MLTRDDIRRIALALPEAHEAPHFDIPSFRVGKKIFCTTHLDHPRIVLKFDPEDQHNLLEEAVVEPVAGSYGRKGWTIVWYERIEPARLETLMRLAWATVAPKRLVKPA